MQKKLSFRQTLVMGGALFSMHFGASCLLYPMTWGKESGSSLWLAYLGVLVTGILMTILGYTALARGKDSFLGLARRVSPAWGNAYCSFVVLLVGPVYIMPRMTAATWDAFRQLLPGLPSGTLPGIVFNLLVYAIVYWFSIGRTSTMGKVGKILFPIQVVIVVSVILKGILTPVSPVMAAKSYAEPSVVYGLLQGYSTGDLLCALMFGLVLISNLSAMGMEGRALRRNLVLIGSVGIGILAITHLGQMVVGAYTGGTINLTLSALYARVVVALWGSVGGLVFMLALLSASISCAVGLTASCAEFFVELGGRKIKYSAVITLTCLLSAVISCLGLNQIVTVLGPLLQASYPAAILLVAYYTFMPRFDLPGRKRGLLAAMVTATVFALMNTLYTYNAQFGWGLARYAAFYRAIPLASYDFAWLPASVIAYAIGAACGGKPIKKEERVAK